MISFSPEKQQDNAPIEALYDRAFGVDRFAKSSYALRMGVDQRRDLGVVAHDNKVWTDGGSPALVGAVRFWPVQVNCLITGKISECLLLGPFAVDPDYRGSNIGRELMRRALAGVDRAGNGCVLLVGEAAYYEKFGFVAASPRTITLPGGRDAHRLLVRQRGRLVHLPTVGTLTPKLTQGADYVPVVAAE